MTTYRTAEYPDGTEERVTEATLEPVLKAWGKDLKDAARLMTDAEVRFLVDFYYAMQRSRIRTAQQIDSAETEPSAVFSVLLTAAEQIENRVRYALDLYCRHRLVGRWALAQYGIGPVITSGLLAHIDIKGSNSVSRIYRFAGLDPDVQWKEGEIRPWNARLKTLCWKIGESFVRFHTREDCIYGHLYAQRKVYEQERNERGEMKETAEALLKAKKWRKDTPTYASLSSGKLPDAQLHARSKRWAVKIFLSHLHEVGYFIENGHLPADPYPFAILSHKDRIEPMHADMIPGYVEARKKKRQESGL